MKSAKKSSERVETKEAFRRKPSVEIEQGSVKALKAFKNQFLAGKEDIPDLKILMVNTGTDVSVMGVFSKSHVTFVESKSSSAKRLAESNLHAFKANYEVLNEIPDPESGESGRGEFNIVVILDADAEPTDKFLRTIKGGGYILCRARMAGALRGSGNYEVMGAIDKEGATPTLAKGSHDEMWGEVATDDEFKEESEHATKGLVTYREAVETLKSSGMKEDEVAKIVEQERVLQEYRKLLENSEGGNNLKGIPWKTQGEQIFILKKSETFAK